MADLKIPFDSLTLCAVAHELRAFEGARVQKVDQGDDYTLGLTLYGGGEGFLLLSCHPMFARAYLSTRRLRSPTPIPGLGAAMRARVEGGRLVQVRQVGFDRILRLKFESDEGTHTLVAELMGKHSNLMLLDGNERLIAAAKWVPKSKSKRPIQAGDHYVPPPFEPRPSLMEARDGDDLSEFEGFSPFLIKLLNAQGPGRIARLQEIIRTSAFIPVFSPGAGAYPVRLYALGLLEQPTKTISLALEQFYNQEIPRVQAKALRDQLVTQLERVVLARDVALHDLRQAADTAARAGQIQLKGELILAHGFQLAPGATLLEVEDYEGNPLNIRLDPELNVVENANRYFEKAKRAKAGADMVHEQIQRLERDRQDVLDHIEKIEATDHFRTMEELQEQANARRWLHRQHLPTTVKEDRPYQGHRIRELLAPGGWTVLYGENAESNDYLTLRVAKPNDYWLHIRGNTSAHVVIVTQNKPEKVGREALMFAAHIAVRNSPSKHGGFVPVDYTLKKYVRKQRGAPKGTAFYTHEKTLHVEGGT